MRIEILYDFDYEALRYLENGLNGFPHANIPLDDPPFLPLEFLRDWDHPDSSLMLGCGLDKICIADAATHNCFIIEPCSALFFCCSMEQTFRFFLEQLRLKNLDKIIGGGILTEENLVRNTAERYPHDIKIGIDFVKIDNEWDIIFSNVKSTYEFRCNLSLFLSAYFDFGERMIRFYDHVIPQYKDLKYYYPLFMQSVKNSVIGSAFEIKKQSGYDTMTYYDYQ